ncbi:hypothetical protein NNO_0520 [Hydrogenimonas sp.]|nr:hypothetical protein NNO_0520 [Hydrogenimonas sp.]
MLRLLLATLTSITFAWAIDYAERSTQELIASLHPGGKNVSIILHELKKREATMTPEEKRLYRKKREEITNVEKK